jgi:hypothetical protein
MYINTSTLAQCTERDIRAAFPNTSFPEPFTAPDGYEWVFPVPQPAYDPITQAVRETTPVLTDKGHWEQQWEVIDLDAETVAANQAQVNAARKQAVLSELASIDLKSIRALREGYQPKIDELEAQAQNLRAELAGL